MARYILYIDKNSSVQINVIELIDCEHGVVLLFVYLFNLLWF